MDYDTQTQYLSALQSKRVEVRGPEQRTFLVPIDLVYKRSKYVRQNLHWASEGEAKNFLDFRETPIHTLEDFVFWMYAAEPTINKLATFEDVVELAVFADNYFFEALHNQALDVLRQKLGDGTWKLQPYIVERIYSALHSDTPLRKMCRVLLNTAHTQLRQNNERQQEIDSWAAVFDTSSDVGKDFYVAICQGYQAHQVKEGGPCRFHWHRDPERQDINRTGDTACLFQRGACFAEWDKYVVPEDRNNVKIKAIGPVPDEMSKEEKMKNGTGSLWYGKEL